MRSESFRWQAGMGAIAGALIADALANGSTVWTSDGTRMLDTAEAMLAGNPLPIDLAPAHAAAVAVRLSTSAAPLLVDSTTVALIDAVGHGLASDGERLPGDPLLAKAAALARSLPFREAVDAAGGDAELALLTGMFVGLEGGLGAIPARLVSTHRAQDGNRGRRYLRGLTNRLLGIELPNWYDPRRRRGPKEVLPGLWLSNLYGMTRFMDEHPDGLVLSLCDEEGRASSYGDHVTFHLDDTPRAKANPSLDLVLDDVLNEIAQARATDQPVLLHCRHGASRTGLFLRLLLVDEQELSPDDALIEAKCLWSHTSEWNTEWAKAVERRASGS